MKTKEVLALTKITRETLCRVVKRGDIRVAIGSNGRYDYNIEDVYRYVGKNRKQLNLVYARVSTAKQKQDLVNQCENLEKYCYAKGYKVDQVFKDIGSGINFEKRKEFFKLLDLVLDGQVARVLIAYKDRLSRVGFGLFKHLFWKFGTEIVVIAESANEKLDSEEIFSEIVSLLHCFSMKLYSNRRLKKIKEALSEKVVQS